MRHTEEGATDGDLPIRVLYKSSSAWIPLITIIYIDGVVGYEVL